MRSFVGTLVAIPATLAVLGVGTASGTEWKFNSWSPPPVPINSEGTVPMFANIEQKSGGTFTIKNFMGGQLFNAVQTMGGVKSGAVDAGVVLPIYHEAELKHHATLADLNALSRDGFTAALAGTDALLTGCEGCAQDYAAQNQMPLGVYSSGNYRLMCAIDVTSFDDLKGKRIGGAGAFLARWFNHIGAARVTMSPAEFQQGLERGVVDCVIGAADWLNSFSLKDSVKTIINDQTFGTFYAINFMSTNKDSWAKLTDEERMLVLKEMPSAIYRIEAGYHANDLKALAEAEGLGIKSVDLGAPLQNAWAEFQKTEAASAIEAGKTRGVENPEQLIETQMASFAKWEPLVDAMAKTEFDWPEEESFVTALWDEVYARLDPTCVCVK